MGPGSISDQELLSILLSPGTRNHTCDMLAVRLLTEFGSLRGLHNRRPGELTAIGGLGLAKACRVVAAAELGRRSLQREGKKKIIQSGADVSRQCAWLASETDEVFLAVSLNSRNRVLGEWVVARGWETGVNLTPRQVFTLLAKESAFRVVFSHNHPSGDPSPSSEDLRFTERLIDAGRSLGIRVLDHVIVASDGFISLRESGIGSLDFG